MFKKKKKLKGLSSPWPGCFTQAVTLEFLVAVKADCMFGNIMLVLDLTVH